MRGMGLAILSATAFGAIAPVAKLAYGHGAEPLPLLSIRFSVAALLLMLILFGRNNITWKRDAKRLRIPGSTIGKLVALGGGLFATETWLFFTALRFGPASIISLVFFSFPLITAVIAFVFRLEQVRFRTFLALGLGSAGVASIFGITGTEIQGLLLALGSAIVVAVYFVLAGIVMRGVPPSIGAAWTVTGAAFSLTLGAILSDQVLTSAAISSGMGLALLTTIAFVALYAAIGHIGSSRSAIALMFEPIVTVSLAAVMLGEVITSRVAIGGALIVSSLFLLSGPPHPISLDTR